jgi:hypothetical protein
LVTLTYVFLNLETVCNLTYRPYLLADFAQRVDINFDFVLQSAHCHSWAQSPFLRAVAYEYCGRSDDGATRWRTGRTSCRTHGTHTRRGAHNGCLTWALPWFLEC